MKRVIASLLCCAAALAQPKPPQTRRDVVQPPAPAFYPIEGIAVEGNNLYTQEQILAATGLRPGVPGGKVIFDMARDRLLATGYFTSVGYRFEPAPGGVTYLASFQVTEVPEVLTWRLEDLPVNAAEFERAAKMTNPLFGPRIPANEQVMESCRRLLQNLSAKEGAPLTVVSKIEPEGKDQLSIVFRPSKPRAIIAEVRFKGNQKVASRYLVQAIAPIAIGAPWYEPRFREYLQNHINPVYESHGMLRVQYKDVTTEPSPTVQGLIVNVTVEEGEVYKLTSLDISGADLPGGTLQREMDIRLDEPVNYTAIGKGLERVMARMKDAGYLKVTYTARRKVNDADKTVEVFVTMVPGDQYMFRKLEITGLDLESEPVVRKLWALQPGEPFRLSYPDYFLQRVREDGLFDNLGKTMAQTSIDEKEKQVDVVLNFKGAADPSQRRKRVPN